MMIERRENLPYTFTNDTNKCETAGFLAPPRGHDTLQICMVSRKNSKLTVSHVNEIETLIALQRSLSIPTAC